MFKENGISDETIEDLANLGISGCANILGCIKMAKHFELTEDDVLCTIGTDSAEMYNSRIKEIEGQKNPHSKCKAYADWLRYMLRQNDDNLEELTYATRKRIHNLKYCTWIE